MNKNREDKDREKQTGLDLRADSEELIRKTIRDAQSAIAMKAYVHQTGQGRDTDTILPNVSWATPTKQMKRGVINSHIQYIFKIMVLL